MPPIISEMACKGNSMWYGFIRQNGKDQGRKTSQQIESHSPALQQSVSAQYKQLQNYAIWLYDQQHPHRSRCLDACTSLRAWAGLLAEAADSTFLLMHNSYAPVTGFLPSTARTGLSPWLLASACHQLLHLGSE